MTSFTLLMPGRILFGRGRAGEAAGIVRSLGGRAFLVHGRNPQRADWLARALMADGVAVTRWACDSEPHDEMLMAATDAARASAADVVVALGGGAAIDLGKAVAALVPQSTGPLDHLEVVGRGLPLGCSPLPFVAIPTTAGTGAEATRNAVIGVPAHRRKVSLRDDRMMARVAIVDPALTDGCPPAVTLASGLDAIAQVIEPYLSCRANPLTDAICQTAIPAGLHALARLVATEDRAARDTMAFVSLSGGIALANAGLGAVHGLAGVIGGMTGAAHGAICGALLPHVLRMNGRMAPGPRMRSVEDWLRTAFGADDGPTALEHWMHAAGLPRLTALGVGADSFDPIAAAAMQASSTRGNPFPPEAHHLRAVLAAACRPLTPPEPA